MSRTGKAAARVRRAAEREHAPGATPEDRYESDSDAALAHPVLADADLHKGQPPGRDWRVDAITDQRRQAGTDVARNRRRRAF